MKFLSLVFAYFFCFNSFADFRPHQYRYLSGPDLVSTLSALFPGEGPESDKIQVRCKVTDFNNRDAIGISRPDLGRPLLDRPTPSFIRWFAGCAMQYISNDLSASNSRRLRFREDYFGGDSELEKYVMLGRTKWKQMPKKLKLRLIEQSVTRLIGPEEVVLSNGRAGGMGEIVNEINDKLSASLSATASAFEGLKEVQLTILVSDEFLRY